MRVTPYSPAAWRRVLVLEPDTRSRDMLARAIREMGFEVRVAGTAESARRFLEDKPGAVDILLIDLELPGHDGLAFLHRLQHDCPDMPAIVLSPPTEVPANRRAIQNGALAEVLPKPCGLGELEIALDRARQRRLQRVQPELPTLPPPDEHITPEEAVAERSGYASASLEEIERRHILATLKKNNGNRTRTAADLGISLRKLYYRLGQYQREGVLIK